LFLRSDAPEWELDTYHIQDYRTAEMEWSTWEDIPNPPRAALQELKDMVALYDGEIHYVDEWIGVVIQRLRDLDLYDPSYIVVVSDHGEEFQEHGGWFHGVTAYAEMTDMPLLIKPPSRPGLAARATMSIDMVDVLPSLAELVGATIRGQLQGQSYAALIDSLLQGKVVESQVSAFVERPPFLYSLQSGNWKLIQKSVYLDSPQAQLFDLSSDPNEQVDLSSVHPDTLTALSTRLTNFLRGLKPAEASSTEGDLDPQTIEALRTLGYVD
jgi:arylsulfatase A-like enzyme